jgi:predicted nucleic acid-binding protein
MSKPRLFLDTNVLLRYLTNDIPEQAQAVETWLRKAGAAECVLVTHHLVLAELTRTLLSYYQRPVAEVQATLLAILNTPGCEVENEHILIQAAHWFGEKNVDFIDAYTAAWMLDHGLEDILTLDRKHFQRFEGLNVINP